MIYPQDEFPLLEEYRKVFPITDRTIFAYDHDIYTNYDLPPDLIVHEEQHHKQQDEYGLNYWIANYLNDVNFRLDMEIDAYRKQLRSIKDRNFRYKIMLESVIHLASGLYGNIITREEATKRLKI